MPQSRRHFEEFAPHSRYKHLILKTYFEVWGRKLLLGPAAGSRVCYVDACAGRGIDDAGNHGSPVIAAKAAAMAEGQLRDMLHRPVEINVIAIEKDGGHYRALTRNLAPFNARVRTLRGTLEDHIGTIESEFSGAPVLYFIDPFGLDPLRADVVRQALARPKNEAFLLFADQAALRHFGAATATETRATAALRQLDAAPFLFEDLHEAERQRLAQRADESEHALDITRERAIEILDTAFGSRDWLPIVEATPRPERRQRFRELYHRFLYDAKALFVLDVPVLNEDGSHVYTLLHATKSRHGYRAMKEAVEYAIKHGPLSDATKAMMWDRLTVPRLDEVISATMARFAGEVVRWAEDRTDRSAPCIRNFVLEETPVFPFQAKAVQDALDLYRLPGIRAATYKVPA